MAGLFGTPATATPGTLSFGTTPSKPPAAAALSQHAMNIPAATKYLDLPPDVKTALGELEKAIYLNSQRSEQQAILTDLPVLSCISKTAALSSASSLASFQFEHDRLVINEIQTASADQFRVAEFALHSLSKLKNGESVQPIHSKFIDDYLVRFIGTFEERTGRIAAILKRLEKSARTADAAAQPSGSSLEQLLKRHNELIGSLACRTMALLERVGLEGERFTALKGKYPVSRPYKGILEGIMMPQYHQSAATAQLQPQQSPFGLSVSSTYSPGPLLQTQSAPGALAPAQSSFGFFK